MTRNNDSAPSAEKLTMGRRSNLLSAFLLAAALLAMAVVASPVAHAATLIVVNNDGPGEGFNDATAVAPIGGNAGTTIGAQRLIAFQHAADIWGGLLASPVQIRVGAQFDVLTCDAFSAILGSAGPANFFRDFVGAPVAGTYYPIALANALNGSDIDPGVDDISATFNSAIGTTCAFPSVWYYGLDGIPPGGQIDFVSVLLHELGHGLGFLTLVNLTTGAKPNGFNDPFMLNLESHGAVPSDYPSMTNAQRVAASKALTNLHWVGANVMAASGVLAAGKLGTHVQMYAPNPQEPGSSVSHWNTTLTPNQIMEPTYTGPLHDPVLELPLFQDIGWTLQTSAFTFSPASYSVLEGAGSVTVTVHRSSTAGIASVTLNTVNGTATAGSDYTAQTNVTVTFADTVGSMPVVIPILEDAIFEGPETFTVQLSNPEPGYSIGSPGTATVSITDNDLPAIQFSSPTYSVSEAGVSVNVTVTRQSTAGTASVTLNTANGSATAGSDYTAQVNTLVSFAAGVGSKNVAIPITNDTAIEGDETFTAQLTAPSAGFTLGTPSSATVTIVDNDNVVEFASATYPVNEAAGNVVLTVNRTGSTGVAATVNYATANGTAIGNAAAGMGDFQTRSGTLSWGIGDAAPKTITIPIVNDALLEGNEAFTVTLSAPTGGAVLGTVKTATVTITDNESGVGLAANAISVLESVGNAQVVVNRFGPGTGAISVNYSTSNGTAMAGSDYTALTLQTLSWADLDTAPQTINIPINDDAAVEANETFNVTLSGAVGGSIAGNATAVVTILDNDNTLQFTAAAFTGTEGGNVLLTVSRTGSANTAASVTYQTIDGAAVAGTDFTYTTGTLNWAVGDKANKTITVPLLNDNVVSGAKTFQVSLSGPAGAVLGALPLATATRSDNDAGLVFDPAVYTVSEATASVTLTVKRVGPTAGAASVQYTTANGSATAGSDYTAKTGTLSWLAGDATAKTIMIPILNDGANEPDETFTVTLFNPTPLSVVLGVPVATVTITDNDLPNDSVIGFDQAKVSYLENIGTATLTVTRTGDPTIPATVNYATVAGTALATTDFTMKTGTLTWGTGDGTSRTILISIANNTTAEPQKQFKVNLTIPIPGSGWGLDVNPTSTVTIVDDDEIFPFQGVFPGTGWSVPGAPGWHVSQDPAPAEGVYSLRTDTVFDNETAAMEYAANFTATGNVVFKYKVSSEAGFDALRFYIDGVKKGEWSGASTAVWTAVTVPITVIGLHTLRWAYEKDGSGFVGSDAAWIDAVTMPANTP